MLTEQFARGFVVRLGGGNLVLERALGVIVVMLIVTLVSVARVRLGSHWPSDIIAGAALGVGWLVFVIIATRMAERSRPAPQISLQD